MSTPTIRPAAPEDLPAAQSIYAVEVLTGTASFEQEPPDLAEITRRFDVITAAGLPYQVAELDGRVAGYAYAASYRPRPAYRYTVENSIYVARWAQRQGVGRVLLQTIIDACEQRGMRQMIAIIGDSAHRASIALHAQAGFRHVGVLKNVGYKFDRWLDTVVMQRSLGLDTDSPGAATAI